MGESGSSELDYPWLDNFIGSLEDDTVDNLIVSLEEGTRSDFAELDPEQEAEPEAEPEPEPETGPGSVKCFACKEPVTSKMRRTRIINYEKRKVCAFCSAHIYRVVFPSKYKKTFYGPNNNPDIVLPEGFDLESRMKEEHASRKKNTPGIQTDRKFKTVLGYPVTENLLSIIMDTYKEHVQQYPIEDGKYWKYWKKIGFTALTKVDANFEPSKKHTSLGTVIRDIVNAKLGK